MVCVNCGRKIVRSERLSNGWVHNGPVPYLFCGEDYGIVVADPGEELQMAI